MPVFEYVAPQKNWRLYVFKFGTEPTEALINFLSVEEQKALALMTSDKRRKEYIQSHYVLRSTLAKDMGVAPEDIRFKIIGEGKPALEDDSRGIDFNLSHSGDYFAIGVCSRGRIGVDIEALRVPNNISQIAKKHFSSAEAQVVSQSQRPEVFAKFWSGKEALIKAVGGGVFKHGRDVLIDETTWNIKKLPQEFGAVDQWNLQYFFDIPGYICSVAVSGNQDERK